jgi:hypothetical protein
MLPNDAADGSSPIPAGAISPSRIWGANGFYRYTFHVVFDIHQQDGTSLEECRGLVQEGARIR